MTPGIVRVGDTVRRPVRPFTATIQAYLAHLRRAGFTAAPVPLGIDDQGREVLSYVPGDVPREPLPAETAGEDVVAALARSSGGCTSGAGLGTSAGRGVGRAAVRPRPAASG